MKLQDSEQNHVRHIHRGWKTRPGGIKLSGVTEAVRQLLVQIIPVTFYLSQLFSCLCVEYVTDTNKTSCLGPVGSTYCLQLLQIISTLSLFYSEYITIAMYSEHHDGFCWNTLELSPNFYVCTSVFVLFCLYFAWTSFFFIGAVGALLIKHA